jgi:hypothetical protein
VKEVRVSFEARRLRVKIPCNEPPSVFADDPSPDKKGPGGPEGDHICHHPPYSQCYTPWTDFDLRLEVDGDAVRKLLEALEAAGRAEGEREAETDGS